MPSVFHACQLRLARWPALERALPFAQGRDKHRRIRLIGCFGVLRVQLVQRTPGPEGFFKPFGFPVQVPEGNPFVDDQDPRPEGGEHKQHQHAFDDDIGAQKQAERRERLLDFGLHPRRGGIGNAGGCGQRRRFRRSAGRGGNRGPPGLWLRTLELGLRGMARVPRQRQHEGRQRDRNKAQSHIRRFLEQSLWPDFLARAGSVLGLVLFAAEVDKANRSEPIQKWLNFDPPVALFASPVRSERRVMSRQLGRNTIPQEIRGSCEVPHKPRQIGHNSIFLFTNP